MFLKLSLSRLPSPPHTHDAYPAHLPSFLCEVITNRFTKDTHNHIVDHTDIQLPGAGSELGGPLRYWRTEFIGEVPRLVYLTNKEFLFRGPIHRMHRFIAGHYFEVIFTMNAGEDMLVTLRSPTDGQFSGHKYWGDNICAELSRDVLRAFVAKLCLLPQTCPPAYQYNLNLLHPDSLIDLLPLLLDCLTIDIELAMKLTEKRDMSAYIVQYANPTTGTKITAILFSYGISGNSFSL